MSTDCPDSGYGTLQECQTGISEGFTFPHCATSARLAPPTPEAFPLGQSQGMNRDEI